MQRNWENKELKIPYKKKNKKKEAHLSVSELKKTLIIAKMNHGKRQDWFLESGNPSPIANHR